MKRAKIPMYPLRLFFELEKNVAVIMSMYFRMFITIISQKKLSSFRPM